MPRTKPTPGTCIFCGLTVSKQGVMRHLSSCAAHQTATQRAERSRRAPENLLQLRARDAYGGQFWLQLEMRGSASLKDLDAYLREIWLECCGHMSQFSVGGWRGEEIPMGRKVANVFEPGLELTHIYDFGTESETRITMAGMRRGPPITTKPITLLARNVMPTAPCIDCGAPATFLCTECVAEHDTWGVLCDDHAETHPHDDYGEPIPLMNSPRMGLCGYTGPATAPY